MRVTAASSAFADFIQKHGRAYRHGSREYEHRQAVFQRSLVEIERLNARPNRLWTAGVNHLTDRTEGELAQLRGWRGILAKSRGESVEMQGRYMNPAMFLALSSDTFAQSVSWEHLNSSNSIIDQGPCGSCWAIASSTVLAAHAEIHAKGRSFSTQELVSCVANPHSCGGTGGCDGATVELALDYVMRYGLFDEHEAPYMESTTPSICGRTAQSPLNAALFNMDELVAPGVHTADPSWAGYSLGLQAWERLPENKYEPFMRAVANRGPVAVSAAASTWSMYSNGIFDNCAKDAVIDHAVTLIGYGYSENLGKQYWLIQNSWGPSWGEGGKIRLLRRDDEDEEQCGTDRQPEVGTGCTGGPAEVRVCGMCGILYDGVVPHFV